MGYFIKYDWIGAYNENEIRHPQEVVRELGLKTLDYEANGIGDMSIIKIDRIPEKLPSFCKLVIKPGENFWED